MLDRIIFFSNDFGFGPMSLAHTVASSFQKKYPDFDISIASSGNNDYLFKSQGIKFIALGNPRSEADISSLLRGFDPKRTLVISVMNRFVFKPAKEQKFRTLLVDGLYWFWKNRPLEYDQADFQLRFVLPWTINDYQDTDKIYYFMTPVDDTSFNNLSKNTNNEILIAINGFITPFYNTSHDIYLTFLSLAAATIDYRGKISVVGNIAIKNKVEQLGLSINYEALDKISYMTRLRSAEVAFLNGGSSSFLEAFWLNKTILFSLPSNQSQYELMDSLSNATHKPIEFWCPLLTLFPRYRELGLFATEAEAIDFWTKEIENVVNSKGVIKEIGAILQRAFSPSYLSEATNAIKKLRKSVSRDTSKEKISRTIYLIAKA